MEQGKLKTRCYYTDYVNHMIRFYITCPESLKTAGKRKSDIDNWIAVQTVFHCLSDSNRDKVTKIYKTSYNLPKAVRMYCQETGDNEDNTWVLLTKVSAMIARRRGLV